MKGKGRLTPFADSKTCKDVISYMIAGANDKKHDILDVMGVAPKMRHYIESKTLQLIMTVFAHLNPIPQLSIAASRIDLYFPKQRVAVEYDEQKHNDYDTHKEATRQLFIESQLSCRFHRFDPYEEGFCINKQMNRLMQVLTEPMYD